MSGFNNNGNDPRFNQQGRPFPHQQNIPYRPPPQFPGQHAPGQVPPFVSPNMGRHPVPPLRFPGQQPQPPHQFPNMHNRPIGAPPLVHQPHQFHNMHAQQRQLPPPGSGFHGAHQAQNMFPVRTSSSGSPSSPSVTSPTQAPSRNLPPIPGPEDGDDSDKNSSGAEKASDGEDRKSSEKSVEKSVEKSRSGLEELRKQAAELGKSEETGLQKTFRSGLDNISAVATVGAAGSAILSQGVASAGKAL
ncbi:MAG: hypothetical protein J3Q66DRAFT_328535, partial [Benniella sp.]